MTKKRYTKNCKICNTEFVAFKSTQHCCSMDCAIEFAKVKRKKQELKEWNKRKKKMKEDLQTVQELLKAAQIVFNKYIRLRDKDKPCISCGRSNEGVKVNAGHYFSSGGHKAVTFNEDNVHLQCEHCNQFLSGNLLNYQVGIEKRIGGERLLKLHEEAHKTRKYTREELRELIVEYKQKINSLNE